MINAAKRKGMIWALKRKKGDVLEMRCDPLTHIHPCCIVNMRCHFSCISLYPPHLSNSIQLLLLMLLLLLLFYSFSLFQIKKNTQIEDLLDSVDISGEILAIAIAIAFAITKNCYASKIKKYGLQMEEMLLDLNSNQNI